MSISIFHGPPTSNGGQSVPSGIGSLGLDVTAGQFYYRTPANGAWQANSESLIKEINLTPNQLLNLVASPILILPAPGVGRAFRMNWAFCSYRFGGTAYGNTTASDLAFIYGVRNPSAGTSNSNTFANLFISSSNMLAQTVDICQYVSDGGVVGPVGAPTFAAFTSAVENQPIYFTRPSHVSTTELTNGNGTLKITLGYNFVNV